MPIFWEPMLLFPLLVMVIPVAILLGQRWRGGPQISLSAGAILGVVIYLALTWASFATRGYEPIENTIGTLALLGGAILLLGALALGFADALCTRRRVWALIQSALVYGSFVGMLGFMLEPVRVCSFLPSGAICAPPDMGRFALTIALMLAGPIATLVYALRTGAQRQPRTLPEGLTITRLTAEEG
jgi:hypothetical protein